jgi:hypothetical protein
MKHLKNSDSACISIIIIIIVDVIFVAIAVFLEVFVRSRILSSYIHKCLCWEQATQKTDLK